ncbi:MAG TPA: CHAP domain-containing protein [Intrasporangiaceae bacterium]|nr:CHAP domain-containing protein [Intrasporangiaceae bacterium]
MSEAATDPTLDPSAGHADEPPVHENVDGDELSEEVGVEQPGQDPTYLDPGRGSGPASRVLSIAAAQIGTVEKPRNSNRVPYWSVKPEWNGSPWCAAFVRWCLLEARMGKIPPIANPYYVPYVESWARTAKRFVTTDPRPGDFVIFGTAKLAQHIGFVERSLGRGWVQTIEGNTSSGTSGSQNNGDGVYRRKRGPGWIRGYVRVDYAAAGTSSSGGGATSTPKAAPKPAPKPASKPAPKPAKPATPPGLLVVDGILGPKSRRGFQQLCGLTGSDVDGSLGPISWRAAQRWAGLSGKDIDGICGPITSDAIARKTGHIELLGTRWDWKSTKATGHAREVQAAFNRAYHEGWRPS